MNQMYTETLEIRACHCDMQGIWKPSSILESMQETAGVHSAQLGLVRDVMDQMGIAWVVTRLKVEFSRVPHVGEKVIIETYPTLNRHLFFPRSHVFRMEDGTEIGHANSLWVTMDITSRKIVKNEFVVSKMPENADLQMALPMPATVRLPEGEHQIQHMIPQYTDLDQNVHVNNTKYLDWCCNAIGLERMKDCCISAFDVNYDAEIRPGCEIQTQLSVEKDGFVFCGFEGEKRHFGVSGKFSRAKIDEE